MIDGVTLTPLKRIADDRGSVWHMLKSTDPVFVQFGEIYFSLCYPGVIKAWHLHTKMDLNYACIAGMVKIVLYDDRQKSPTYHELNEFCIGEDNYALLHIPRGVINGLTALGTKTSMIANCATLPHDPEEMIRLDPATSAIPYQWHVTPR
jgi:dTDP-4-dehydrorhamnose 3,5-epimerase